MVQGDSEFDDAEKLMTFREVHRTDSETKIAHGVHEGVNERIMQPSEEPHLKHGWLHTGPDGCEPLHTTENPHQHQSQERQFNI